MTDASLHSIDQKRLGYGGDAIITVWSQHAFRLRLSLGVRDEMTCASATYVIVGSSLCVLKK